MKHDHRAELYAIASDAEDFLQDGFRRVERPKPVFKTPLSPVTTPSDLIEAIGAEVRLCTRCRLAATRTRAVPGDGSTTPVVMLVGEGPGADEDRTGIPFVGAAGRYLDKWLDAIGLSRESDCFIANIVKCRPPKNRNPGVDEAEACMPFLERQVDALKPRVILALGRVAIQNLLQTTRGLGVLRGGTYSYRGVPVIPTYHPSGVLRNPEYRKPVWEDLKRLTRFLAEASGEGDFPSNKGFDG